jgi:hypothetical protein
MTEFRNTQSGCESHGIVAIVAVGGEAVDLVGEIPALAQAARMAFRTSLNSGSGDCPCLKYCVSPTPTMATL